MPVTLKPRSKPAEPAPHGVVHTAGKQEDFAAAAIELAADFGWTGDDPELVGNDIAVEDARGFILKSLHEAHNAGALEKGAPAPEVVCGHLGLSDPKDLALAKVALDAAFTAGKGKPLEAFPIKFSAAKADVTLPISKALEAAQAG